MKQIFTLFTQPSRFFNQLQWSTNHWFILVAFLGLALVETQVGRGQNEFFQVALWIQKSWNLSFNFSLWIVLAGRLFCIALGAYVVTTSVWLVGNFFGERTSRRVLARRLAVVFTVALAAYTAQYFVDTHALFGVLSLFLYVWSVVLGYFAIRENFGLSHLESVVVGLFALLLVTTSWHYGHVIIAHKANSMASDSIKGSNQAGAFSSKEHFIHIVR